MNLLSLFLPMSYRTHLRLCWLALAGVWLASTPPAAVAQQQFQGLCAQVKIVILQELTLERVGFEATLEVTNNDGEDPITDFLAELTFENPLQSTNQMKNDASGLFFVRAPTLENVNSVNGDGSIGSTRKAVAKWFIIPKINAGGTSPNGVRYRIGARLDLAQKLQVARPGQIQPRVARHRLDDDAGDVAGVRRKSRPHRLRIIERQHNRMLRERRRNARAVRMPKRERARARLHQQ